MPAPPMETLTAVYWEEAHRWDSTAILRCGSADGESYTIKAYECEEGELQEGITYTFWGKWEEYKPRATQWNPEPEAQLQFHARKWRKVKPYDKAGVINWLKNCPGIKEGIARRLWNAYGPDAIERVKESPEQVAQEIGGGFTAERAKRASAHLVENDQLEAAFVDLASILDGRGFPHSLPKKLVRDYGGDAAADLVRNPWLLLQYKSTGVSRTDKLYLDHGGNPAAIKRQAIILWKCLLDAGQVTGDTWQREAAAEEMLRGRIAGAELQFQKAIELGVRAKLIARRWEDGGGILHLWLAEGRRAKHEHYIAEAAARISCVSYPITWPEVGGLNLSPHQAEVICRILYRTWAILGGSPGTGKTYSAAQIIRAMAAAIGIGNIAACARTGKAAARLSELLNEHGINMRARTIHSLLGVATSTEKDGWGFKHDEKDPLPYRLIVIDEASMVEDDLFCAFLRAIPAACQLLIIGDIHQLPPVGCGAPLRDMIKAGLPYGELTEIRRNAGTIVRACAAIRDGRPFETDAQIEFEKNEADPNSPHNLKIIPTSNNAQSVNEIVTVLRKLRTRGFDPIWDCLVLVATNGIKTGKSELSRLEINKRLQNELNPSGASMAGSPFRTGDPIICLKNGFMPPIEDSDPFYDPEANSYVDCNFDLNGNLYAANGERGRVLGQVEKIVYARFDSPFRLIKIPRGKANNNSDDDAGDDDKTTTGCSFDLAYGITIHKSQGSEIPIVLLGLDETPGARMVLSREAIYTGISRAKKLCLLFGKRPILNSFIRREELSSRKTFLTESISEAIDRLERERK